MFILNKFRIQKCVRTIATITKIKNARTIRLETRIYDSRNNIEKYLTEKDYEKEINNGIVLYKKMLDNPIKTYIQMKNRIEKNINSYMPEFKGTIYFLLKKIFQDDNKKIYKYLQKNQKIILDILFNKIISINIKEYHHYTYKESIYLIEYLLEILEIYYRENDNYDIFYHSYRYKNLLKFMIEDKEFGLPHTILYPYFQNIDAIDFIKLRCVPIQLLGVVSKPTKGDQYINTPLEYFYHDMQHARRCTMETESYYNKYFMHKNYYTNRTFEKIEKRIDFYKYMNKYTNNIIIPLININEKDTEHEKGIKHLMKMIIFEIIHEKGWVITNKSIIRNILLKYDKFPVEIYTIKKNISSKIIFFDDPTTLHNLFGKLNSGFYDEINNNNINIVPTKYRTINAFKDATLKLLKKLKYNYSIDDKFIEYLITDIKNADEFFENYDKYIDQNKIIPYDKKWNKNLYDDNNLTYY
jgi:hypothetical protein